MNDRQKSLAVVGMVCVALIMGMYGSGGNNPFFSGSSPTATPYYYTDPYLSPPITATPIPTREPPTVTHYMTLSMTPTDATTRDTITGTLATDLKDVDVTIQYFLVGEGIQYQIPVHVDSGFVTFTTTLGGGEWHFWGELDDWMVYGELYSNSVTVEVYG